ncbi:MAG TPA: hypothetical protein VFY87_13335 [Geminicoccaceae bacterium]|nr:hypothetical protein [Geminicoccaceae bacterium]
MSPWPKIPADVIDWFRDLFGNANRSVSETFLNIPAIRETSLNDLLVQCMIPRSAPTRLASGILVQVDVHNIGGLRRLMSWEVGDIAILVFVIHQNRIIARKVAVLQAKRLYPSVGDIQDEDEVGFHYGMNFFLRRDESPSSMLLTRNYEFDENSTYGALRAGSKQQKVIKDFEVQFGSSIYYLLYNPPYIPLTVRHPVECYRTLEREPPLGARVVQGAAIHELLSSWPEGRMPTLAEVTSVGTPAGGWRIEAWAADLLLTCREGSRYETPDEPRVRMLLERRSGPIGAAIVVSIELPNSGMIDG